MASGDALELQYVALKELKPFEQNPRRLSKDGLAKLKRSIQEFGFKAPIVAQQSSGMIVAGNQRFRAAKELGLKQVPVIYADFDDATARAYALADNRVGEEAEWDVGELSGIMHDLMQQGMQDLSLLGFGQDEIDRLVEVSSDTSFLEDMAREEPSSWMSHMPGDPDRTRAVTPAQDGSSATRTAAPTAPEPAPPSAPDPEPAPHAAEPSAPAPAGPAYVSFHVTMTVEQREQLMGVLRNNQLPDEPMGATLWRVVTHG